MTEYETLKARLSECQDIAAQMQKSGAWDDLIDSVAESIEFAAFSLEGTYALTSDELAVRARDEAGKWRRVEAMEKRSAV